MDDRSNAHRETVRGPPVMKLKTIKLTSLTASLKGHPEAAEETDYNGVGAGLRWGGGGGGEQQGGFGSPGANFS